MPRAGRMVAGLLVAVVAGCASTPRLTVDPREATEDPPPRADPPDGRGGPRTVTADDGARATIADATPAGATPAGRALDGDAVPLEILVRTRPTALVHIDGAPVWRPVAGTTLARVFNTRALLVHDRADGRYYVWVGDTWYRARRLAGPWRTAPLLPARLAVAKARALAARPVELFDERGGPIMSALAHGEVPRIEVRTAPAAVVVLDGAPRLEPVADGLWWVANSDGDLFWDAVGRRDYARLFGRWYAAPALAGPWTRIAPHALPAAFARIPADRPCGRVLASVPGTPQARAAARANAVPETATLRLALLRLDVRYDGAPRFAPLRGTLLRWAINSDTPVLEVAAPLPRAGAPGLYYAVRDGVWFRARDARGPWQPATDVPEALYDLPAAAPLHYVSYVRVYGADDGLLRVGFTGGYLGAYLTRDGVVVRGTGHATPPWIGSVFLPRPAPFGDGAPGPAAAVYRRWGRALVEQRAPPLIAGTVAR